MTESRLQPQAPAQAGWFAGVVLRFVYWLAKRRVGKTPTPMQVQGHQPWILLGYGMMEEAQRFSTALPIKLKSLCSLRAASLIGCRF